MDTQQFLELLGDFFYVDWEISYNVGKSNAQGKTIAQEIKLTSVPASWYTGCFTLVIINSFDDPSEPSLWSGKLEFNGANSGCSGFKTLESCLKAIRDRWRNFANQAQTLVGFVHHKKVGIRGGEAFRQPDGTWATADKSLSWEHCPLDGCFVNQETDHFIRLIPVYPDVWNDEYWLGVGQLQVTTVELEEMGFYWGHEKENEENDDEDDDE